MKSLEHQGQLRYLRLFLPNIEHLKRISMNLINIIINKNSINVTTTTIFNIYLSRIIILKRNVLFNSSCYSIIRDLSYGKMNCISLSGSHHQQRSCLNPCRGKPTGSSYIISQLEFSAFSTSTPVSRCYIKRAWGPFLCWC